MFQNINSNFTFPQLEREGYRVALIDNVHSDIARCVNVDLFLLNVYLFECLFYLFVWMFILFICLNVKCVCIHDNVYSDIARCVNGDLFFWMFECLFNLFVEFSLCMLNVCVWQCAQRYSQVCKWWFIFVKCLNAYLIYFFFVYVECMFTTMCTAI